MRPARYFRVDKVEPRARTHDNDLPWQALLWWRGQPFFWHGKTPWTAVLCGARILRKWEVSKLTQELKR